MVGSEGDTLLAGSLVQDLPEDALLFTHVVHLPCQPIGQRRRDQDDDELNRGRQHAMMN